MKAINLYDNIFLGYTAIFIPNLEKIEPSLI